jgi:hypothetical protein
MMIPNHRIDAYAKFSNKITDDIAEVFKTLGTKRVSNITLKRYQRFTFHTDDLAIRYAIRHTLKQSSDIIMDN